LGEKLRVKTGGAAALASAVVFLFMCSGAWANHNSTEVVSTGPNGGNGAFAGVFRGASADGTRVFLQTSEQLTSDDTDAVMDIYERAGGVTTRISTGPNGGNGPNSAPFSAVSKDGSRVFFRTSEKLVASDTDSAMDLYERANGTTTLISTGPAGGNGALAAGFNAISEDGSRVLFSTSESLVASDNDANRDIYMRSGGTTTLQSTGPAGGNGDFDASFAGIPADGSHVYFHTDEIMVSSDFDAMQDVYDRSAGATAHLSIGPAGGNGNLDFDYDAFFDGASANGSTAWIHTDEVLVGTDTDVTNDVYEHSGGGISVLSTGPTGGNADTSAYFAGASQDGSRVFFDTQEPLTGGDGDAANDVYQRAGGATTLISTGPGGGNGPVFSSFQGASSDGTRVFFQTADSLLASDIDGFQDVYERTGGTTTLVSTGPVGGNGLFDASFKGASKDGSSVFFDTMENLVPGATGTYTDLYERSGGATTFLSTGPIGGNGDFLQFFDFASDDGSRVFFETDEPLVSTDTDTTQDVYMSSITGGYPRPKGATPMYASLVPTYNPCTAPNRTHGPGLSFPSCNPPAQVSSFLTVGSPDSNGAGANSVAFVKLAAIPGVASTPADEADIRFTVSITDVRLKAGLADYAGQLELNTAARITDRLNGSSPVDPGTVSDLPFPVTVPCATTADASVGSTCSIITTADTVLPGTVREIKRTMWQLDPLRVSDGGADGIAATAGNTPFLTQGLFVP
jgi:hypothetical protein